MAEYTNKKFQRASAYLENVRQKTIVRVWGLAKRLDPRTMKGELKKKKGEFTKFGNK